MFFDLTNVNFFGTVEHNIYTHQPPNVNLSSDLIVYIRFLKKDRTGNTLEQYNEMMTLWFLHLSF